MTKNKEYKEYLGDGVYASFNNYRVKLETLEGMAIYLNDATAKALETYIAKIWNAPVAAEDKEW